MRYSIGELARRAAVTRRTIRFYVEEGLLPPPQGVGRSATYDTEHLDRLERIRQLKDLRLSLDEIREALSQKPDIGWSSRLAAPNILPPSSGAEPTVPDRSAAAYLDRLRAGMGDTRSRAPPETKPQETWYSAEPWLRIPLSDDIELQVRRRGNRIDRRVAKLVKEARRILEEEEDEE